MAAVVSGVKMELIDYTSDIICVFEILEQEERAKRDHFRAKAYKEAIIAIRGYGSPIYRTEDVVGIRGIGKSMRDKIDQIIANNGHLARADVASEDPALIFAQIHGIGPVKAAELVSSGIRTIDELRLIATSVLNEKQLLGLKYFESFQSRIPRHEMNNHADILQTVFKKAVVHPRRGDDMTIAGSYRRGAPSSGDIDVLITNSRGIVSALSDFIAGLREIGYIIDSFAQGEHKFMGVCRIIGGSEWIPRRLDIMFTSRAEYPFAILYFTGSASFNTKMRRHALDRGWSMNEHGLTKVGTGEKCSHKFRTERDIFDFLEYPFVTPELRI